MYYYYIMITVTYTVHLIKSDDKREKSNIYTYKNPSIQYKEMHVS